MQQSIDRSGGHGNKGTEAAIAAIKMALFANRLWHIKKKSKFIAHWSFADRQRIAFRVEGIEQ
jgi:O-succinylbenzoate synthase